MANADVTPDELAEDAEAAAAGEAGEQQEEGGRKLPKPIILIAAAVGLLTLVGGGVGAAFFLGWFGGESAEDVALQQAQAPRFYYDLPELTVNLSNAEQRAQYLRISVALEIPNEEVANVLELNLPRVIDVFQTYLRELRVSDLEGSAGLFRLRHELQRRINLAIFPAEVDAVLFREIIVQ